METTIYKKVRGITMELMVANSYDDFIVKFYKPINEYPNCGYNSIIFYDYEILIRHSNNTDAVELFKTELKKIKF